MKYIILLLLTCLIFAGCKKEKVDPICGCATPYQIYYLKAKVTQTSDIACSLPVLDFSEDSLRIRDLTKLSNLT